MLTRNRLILAAALLLIPIFARLLFYYQLPYSNPGLKQPDFTQNTIPEPPTPSVKAEPVIGAASGKIILIDRFHGNQFDPSEIEPLVTALSARGASVEYDDGSKPLELELKYTSAYLVFAPTTAFSGDELRLVQQFVANGGRLLVFADPTRALTTYDFFGNPYSTPDVNFSNPLIAPFGLTLVNDYLYNVEENEGNFRNVKFTSFADNPLTADLHMVVFYGAHSIQAETGTPLLTGTEKTLSSLTDRGGSLSPLALSANQQVLAVGDFTFITNPYNQVADNTLLLAHLADFAVGAERKPALANFPYLFQRPVSLIATGDWPLVTEGLEPVSNLQKTLKAVNLPLKIRTQPVSGTDLIILGTFAPDEDLTPYLKPFGLTLEEDSETVELPGIGKVSTSGNGLLLFNQDPKVNTLILLAPSPKDLPDLMNLVASGDLSACVLQDQIGVCGLGESSDSGDSDYYYDESTPTPEAEGTIEATPTASG